MSFYWRHLALWFLRSALMGDGSDDLRDYHLFWRVCGWLVRSHVVNGIRPRPFIAALAAYDGKSEVIP
ncbi:MAG: hypothetical protein R3271_14290 [Methylophaga sp.]|uniref:hypothetical protein n=1 Tax=Methylophaga sp. TaxID=2024840 RepID=UPI00299D6EFE|nr:hypothetical protein [Methylophaga sp.]MDX1751474.1 hypothetical protein [Methylophaga sp.]